jgi:hypothetical protein
MGKYKYEKRKQKEERTKLKNVGGGRELLRIKVR